MWINLELFLIDPWGSMCEDLDMLSQGNIGVSTKIVEFNYFMVLVDTSYYVMRSWIVNKLFMWVNVD